MGIRIACLGPVPQLSHMCQLVVEEVVGEEEEAVEVGAAVV